jgi:hypothetical protein
MRLVKYRANDANGLTEAVFADAQGQFWHAQRLEIDRGDEQLRDITIQYARLEQLPPVGEPAKDYDRLASTYGDSLRFRHFWHELMLAAFRSDDGSEAAARTVSSLIAS